MKCACLKFCGSAIGCIVFFLSWVLMLWIGIAMLIPQTPFQHRDTPTGVCLIALSTLLSFIGGYLAGMMGFVCCMPFDNYIYSMPFDDYIDKCVYDLV
jgi:hypothetical protein